MSSFCFLDAVGRPLLYDSKRSFYFFIFGNSLFLNHSPSEWFYITRNREKLFFPLFLSAGTTCSGLCSSIVPSVVPVHMLRLDDLFLPFIEGTGLNPANNFGKSSKHHPDIKMFFTRS